MALNDILPGCLGFGMAPLGNMFRVANDYSEDATLRSIDDSLRRLRTDKVEIVWVHDVAQDFYGNDWLDIFEKARKGAFRALDRLRDKGVIQAWGLGVDRVEPIAVRAGPSGGRRRHSRCQQARTDRRGPGGAGGGHPAGLLARTPAGWAGRCGRATA